MVSTLLLLGGGLILGTIGLGGATLFGVQQFVNMLFSNVDLIVTAAALIGAVYVYVRNSSQEDPNWRRDLTGLGIILVIVFGVIYALPFLSGSVSGMTADMTVTVTNPALSNPSIAGVEIDNFRNPNALEPSSVGFTFEPASIGGITDDVSGDIRVTCGGEEVSDRSFNIAVTEETAASETVQIQNLPRGGNCWYSVEISKTGDLVDSTTGSFSVPG